ncbi:MAG: hypothetical protein DMF26_08415 [Verrucomicrobia bacterium]|nr:MAG: hypothetical protein DMF26_08415 [Verrucomicrobiota bacterium]
MHNETLPVTAMSACNPDRLPIEINRWDTAPTPTGLAEIVSDYVTRTMSGNLSRVSEKHEHAR